MATLYRLTIAPVKYFKVLPLSLGEEIRQQNTGKSISNQNTILVFEPPTITLSSAIFNIGQCNIGQKHSDSIESLCITDVLITKVNSVVIVVISMQKTPAASLKKQKQVTLRVVVGV